MSKVYVIQDSPGKNLQPAKEYGELVVMLTSHDKLAAGDVKLTNYLHNFTDKDYLLLIGNPFFIAQAVVIASFTEGISEIKCLVWDREHYTYNIELILC